MNMSIKYGNINWVSKGRNIAVINLVFILILWKDQPHNWLYPIFFANLFVAAISAHKKFRIGWAASLPISFIYLFGLVTQNNTHLLVIFVCLMTAIHFFAATWAFIKIESKNPNQLDLE